MSFLGTPEAQNSRRKAESGGRVLVEGSSELCPLLTSYIGGLGERCKLPQHGSGQSPDCKYILDLLRA